MYEGGSGEKLCPENENGCLNHKQFSLIERDAKYGHDISKPAPWFFAMQTELLIQKGQRILKPSAVS